MTRSANVAYSRATPLTVLACPLNMQRMPGALQVLAALLHGVQTVHTYDDQEPSIRGSLDLTPIQVAEATVASSKRFCHTHSGLGHCPFAS